MAKRLSKPRITDAEQVAAYMQALAHPMKEEAELLRIIIKSADARIGERIKWNAPSYCHFEDIVTFGPFRPGPLLLVFHHPFIVNIHSALLAGDFKDRRLAWFNNMAEINAAGTELVRIIKAVIADIDLRHI